MQQIIRIDLNGVNCYLIKNDGKFILVDTGGHMFLDKEFTNRRDELEKSLLEHGVNEHNLCLIILTHGDNDHVCNARYIREKFNSRIAMHEKDAFMVEKADPNCYKLNCKYKKPIFKLAFHLMNSKIERLMEKVYREFEVFQPDGFLQDGDDLSAYGFDGTIYLMPGHTEGSICILDSEGNLLCGDLFANNKKPSLAVNAQDFKRLKDSADKIMSHKVRMVYPGHGTPYTIS